MKNGIRQGSLISPYLFNVYVDELNFFLANSGGGCHIAGKAAKDFSYADDLALVAPTARALNQLNAICESFSVVNYVKYITSKTVCMCILPQRSGIVKLPNI